MSTSLRSIVHVCTTIPSGTTCAGGGAAGGSTGGLVEFTAPTFETSEVTVTRHSGDSGRVFIDVVGDAGVLATIEWAAGEFGPKTVDLGIPDQERVSLANPRGVQIVDQSSATINGTPSEPPVVAWATASFDINVAVGELIQIPMVRSTDVGELVVNGVVDVYEIGGFPGTATFADGSTEAMFELAMPDVSNNNYTGFIDTSDDYTVGTPDTVTGSIDQPEVSVMQWDAANTLVDGANPPVLAFSQNDSRVDVTAASIDGSVVDVLSLKERGAGYGWLYAEHRVTFYADTRGKAFCAKDVDDVFSFANFDFLPGAGGSTDISVGAQGYGYQTADVVNVPHGQEFVLRFLYNFSLGRAYLGVDGGWFRWVSFAGTSPDPEDGEHFEFTPGNGFKLGIEISPDDEVTGDTPRAVLCGRDDQYVYGRPSVSAVQAEQWDIDEVFANTVGFAGTVGPYPPTLSYAVVRTGDGVGAASVNVDITNTSGGAEPDQHDELSWNDGEVGAKIVPIAGYQGGYQWTLTLSSAVNLTIVGDNPMVIDPF